MIRSLRIYTIICIFSLMYVNTNAQCNVNNEYFQAGEALEYDLYLKFGFASTKGGYAQLKTGSAKYDNKDVYKMDLISESQGLARKIFSLNDTLTSYMSNDLIPLVYIKNAHEGGDYTKEKLTYKYASDGKVNIRTIRHKNGDFKFDENIQAPSCTYDLVSILYYCRGLDFEQLSKNSSKTVNFISGKNRGSMKIVNNGKEIVEANDGLRYNCIKLTLYIADEAFNNGKEAMKVYISDDKNRMPIKLETKLKTGSTRAVLKNYKGNKHPLNVVR